MLDAEPAAQQQATLGPERQTQHEPRNQIIPPPATAAIPATGTSPTDDTPVSEAAPAIAQRSAGAPLAAAADVYQPLQSQQARIPLQFPRDLPQCHLHPMPL